MPEEQAQQVPTPETQTETPTNEPTPEELKAQLAQLNKALEETKKGLSTAHQTLTKKDQELKRQAALDTRLDGIESTQKVLAALIAEATGKEAEAEDSGTKQQRLDRYKELVADIDKKKADAEAKARQDAYAEKADAIWQRATALGLTAEDDDYWTIRDSLMNGNADRAEAKIGKLERVKSGASPTPKPTEAPKAEKPATQETEEEKVERLVRERIKALTKTDTAVPSGPVKNREKAMAEAANGPTDLKKLRELGFY